MEPPPPQVAAGLLTVGDVILVNALFAQLAGPLSNVGDVYRPGAPSLDVNNPSQVMISEVSCGTPG